MLLFCSEDVPLMDSFKLNSIKKTLIIPQGAILEFMDLVFTRMLGESYRAVVSVDVNHHVYLLARVTVGSSGLCGCTCVTSFERKLTPLRVDSVQTPFSPLVVVAELGVASAIRPKEDETNWRQTTTTTTTKNQQQEESPNKGVN